MGGPPGELSRAPLRYGPLGSEDSDVPDQGRRPNRGPTPICLVARSGSGHPFPVRRSVALTLRLGVEARATSRGSVDNLHGLPPVTADVVDTVPAVSTRRGRLAPFLAGLVDVDAVAPAADPRVPRCGGPWRSGPGFGGDACWSGSRPASWRSGSRSGGGSRSVCRPSSGSGCRPRWQAWLHPTPTGPGLGHDRTAGIGHQRPGEESNPDEVSSAPSDSPPRDGPATNRNTLKPFPSSQPAR